MKTFDLGAVTAYAIAVENGYKGTESEWLESLKGESGTFGDWNAKEGEPGHVLHRTHWVEDGGMTEIIPETTLTPYEYGTIAIPTEVPNLVAGDTYIVNWNGVEYNCVAQEIADEDITGNAIGNAGAITGGTDTGEPFMIWRLSDDSVANAGIYAMIFVLDGSTSVTLSIYGKGEIVHKLDNKFLDLEWIPAPKGEKTLVPTFTVSNGDSFVYDFRGVISNGQKVNVIFDNVKYKCNAIISNDTLLLCDVPITDTIPESYVFCISGYPHGIGISCTDGEHTLSISVNQYEKIPQHYLSELHAISSISGSVGEANQYLEQGYPVKYSNSFVLGAQTTDAQGSYLAYAHPWGYRLYNNHFLNLLGTETAIAAMLPNVGAKVGQHLEVVSTGEMTLFKTVDPWVLTAPDGTKYKLTVDNSGALSTEKVT